MKVIPIIAAILGLAMIGALVGYFGAGAVVRSLRAIGWAGFSAICVIHLAVISLEGIAWWLLVPRAHTWAFIWGRLIRDAGSEVLPVSQMGGCVLGARAVALPGMPVSLPVTFGLATTGLFAIAFVIVQRHGFAFFDRLARMLGRGWAERTASGMAAVHAALAETYRRRAGLWGGFALHLGCWMLSAVEVWIALRLAGAPLGFPTVLVIESLLYAIRTVAFAIPNAVGVQEGAYVLIGAAFGLTPEMALAISLLKRARDLVIGLPALATWQIAEGGRLWRKST